MTEDWIWDIRHFLEAREASPERPFWFMDQGEVYCYDCIKAINPDAKIGEDYEGGGTDTEEDGPNICEQCGKLLAYTLTDYGVDAELANFLEFPPDVNDPGQCYELDRIAWGVFTPHQKRQLKQIFAKIPIS